MAELGKPGIPRRGIYGWMMFDWAAQPFFTVVTTFIFGPYFVAHFAGDAATGQALWGYAAAFSGILIAVLSPVLGSIADQTGPRKPWIGVFAIFQIIGCFMLWYAAPGANPYMILAYFIIATLCAEFSIVFNDSMMPRLVTKAQIGRVSNIAWALGYLGGMICLIFVLATMAASSETGKTIVGLSPIFGLDPANFEGDRAVGPLAAIWYAIFILPMFLFTPDPDDGGRKRLAQAVYLGLSELKETIAEVRQKAGVFRFLVARMIYQDGVNGLIILGGTFAAAMFGWKITEIGIFGIILNVAAIIGNLTASVIDTKLGSKRVVIVALFMLIAATIGIVSTGVRSTAEVEFVSSKLTELKLDQNVIMSMIAAREKDFIVSAETTQSAANLVEFHLNLNKGAINKLEDFVVVEGTAPVRLSDIAELRQGTSTIFGFADFLPSDVRGMFSTAAEKAYILYGLLIGLALGPVQASSRAYMARSVTSHEAGRYFGLYALSGRATSFLAPFTVATVTAVSGSPRLGIAMLMFFFIVGLIILWKTPYPAAAVEE